jgi:hypothetical protein
MDWMFEEQEYVAQCVEHVCAAYRTLHDEHVEAYKDRRVDIALAKMGARRVMPALNRLDENVVQPMSGPVPLSFFSRSNF